MVSPICSQFAVRRVAPWGASPFRPRPFAPLRRLNQVPGFKMRALDHLVLTRLPSLVYYPERKNRQNPLNRVRHVTRHKMGYFVLNSANSG